MASPTRGFGPRPAPPRSSQTAVIGFALQEHGIQIPLAGRCFAAGARVPIVAPAWGGGRPA
eukprot:10140917-Alexandrium_andersonii.AAC.1